MSFSVSPTTGFPPPAPDAFPMGLQWQLAGVNVGDRTVDTVNFVTGDALDMYLDADNPKLLIIVIPAGSGGGGG